MRIPSKEAIAVTAGLALSALPAHAEAQDTQPIRADQDKAALDIQAGMLNQAYTTSVISAEVFVCQNP